MARQQLMVVGTQPGNLAPKLAGRPRLILQELAHHDGEVTFTGLRRRLGIHPQALTRELRRLEQEQAIERTTEGYRLADEGAARVDDQTQQTELVEVLRLVLPPGADADSLANDLAGRWFGHLRWYGRADGPGELVLLWLTEPDGTMVRLRLVGGMLLIEAESGSSQAVAPLLAAAADHLIA